MVDAGPNTSPEQLLADAVAAIRENGAASGAGVPAVFAYDIAGRAANSPATGARAGPVAVLASPARLIPCGVARAIDRGRLRAWRETA